MTDFADIDPDVLGLDVSEWVNSDPIDAASLRGQVVMVETFQMLCPGCIEHGLPTARRVHNALSNQGVRVLGLHTVFEHHKVQDADALRVFVAEYRFPFPIGIDRPVPGRAIPSTMDRYQLQGTPSTLVADRAGRIRSISFGQVDEIKLAALLGRVLAEPAPEG
ncbi:TlpA family protein disulfide reductase [Gulosibacter macacae]|uniref:TlpA family protein disulfide reductase n=1 Tax=Gulosibacter macacae TaxID=2488791 RepID=A0A3P3VXU7_9MICO|nr:redoxin domain-containing protein [Gulosibacter macacae]RRJ87520.1 TlpA family protein disulfide reductase [Gulosibacter macacae]